jgi:hypothetical protein
MIEMRQSHHILEVTPHYQYVFKQRCPLRNLISADLLSGVHGRRETASGYSIIEENFGIEESGAFRVEALCKPKDKRDDLPLVTVWGWR